MGLICDPDTTGCQGNGRPLRKCNFNLTQLAADLLRCVLPASHISPFSDSKTLTLELDRFLGGRSEGRKPGHENVWNKSISVCVCICDRLKISIKPVGFATRHKLDV